MAADVIRDVNKMKDKDGISYARKSMIMTGLALNLEGVWAESQLSDQLQTIIAKYRANFDGTPVDPADIETESESEDDEVNN